MLFVLLVVGLLVGLSVPRLGAGIDRYELLSQRQTIEDQLRQLPRRARLAARSVELPDDLKVQDLGDGDPVLSVPPGWSIRFTPPLVISRLGACSASVVALVPANRAEEASRFKITEFSCEVQPLNP